MHNSFYNSYCLLLDRFWSNLRILSEVLNNNASQGYNQMGLVLNLNQHINDSVLDATNGDECALQFDPRIDQLSTPRCFNELLAKSVSDKQVATIDEKSSQTEVHHLGLSVDENSQRSLYEIAEEQSPSLNDNKERISQKTQDSGINEVASPKQQEVKKLIDFEPISVRMNLKHCDLQEQKQTRKAEIRKRCHKQHIECLTELVPVKPVVKSMPKSESKLLCYDNEQVQSNKTSINWFSRVFKFLLFLFLTILMFVVCLAVGLSAYISPGCCDFNRQFLMFNTKHYNDGPLPH